MHRVCCPPTSADDGLRGRQRHPTRSLAFLARQTTDSALNTGTRDGNKVKIQNLPTASRHEGTLVRLTGANRPLQSNAVGARGAGAYRHQPGGHVHVLTQVGPLRERRRVLPPTASSCLLELASGFLE